MTEHWRDRVVVVASASAALLGVAVLDMPYGYYQFLKIAVTLASLYLAFRLHQEDQVFWMLAALAAAILFNPVIEIDLDEDAWKMVDIVAAAGFASLVIWRVSPAKKRSCIWPPLHSQ